MADVFIELSDLEISRSDVMESTDVKELRAWQAEQDEVAQELAIMLGTMKQYPGAETHRMARKLGYVNVSLSWIRKRLVELGEELEPDRKGLKKHLAMMEGHLREYKEKLKVANAENHNLREENAKLKKQVA